MPTWIPELAWEASSRRLDEREKKKKSQTAQSSMHPGNQGPTMGIIAFLKFCKKNQSPYTFPEKSFPFFFQTIDARLSEIRRTKKSSTSRSIDFTHVKWKTQSKNVIYDVCERVWCCLTESRSRLPAGHTPNQNARILPAILRDLSLSPLTPPPPRSSSRLCHFLVHNACENDDTINSKTDHLPPPPPPKAIHVDVFRIG